ncbi:unnamed protein product [Closterium sp. NIES-54]
MVTTTTPGGQRVTIYTCTRTGRHLATFTRWPGSSLYTLATEPPQVVASAQVSASGQVAASCSCRLLSHQNLLWHHRLGHPSLPRLRGVHSRLLVSGLPRSLPPIPPLPAPPCLPCVEGRQRAAPHSSSFPLTNAPLQTLHMDVKGQVVDVLIPWIRTVRLQLPERFGQDLPVLRLHSDKGDSPQKNGIAERRIGLVTEVARTSMIHAAAPHFPWPFAVWYAAHQLNLWPRVSLPETSPTLRWTGEVGDASVFWDVTFDESVPFYRFFPNRSAPPPPPPLFLAPGPPPVDPLPGPAPVQVAVGSGAARGAASGGVASGGAEPGGAESEGAETGGVEPGGAEPVGVEPGGAALEGAESGGAEPQGAASSGGSAGALLRLSPQQLREWFSRRARLRSGASGARGAGVAEAGGAGVPAGAGFTGGIAATGPGGARIRGTGAARTGGVEGAGAGDSKESRATGAGGSGAGGARAGGAGVGGAGVGGTGTRGNGAGGAGAVDPGGAVRPRPYFVPLLQQPASPLPAPSPYIEQSGGLIERRDPVSCLVLPVRTARRVPRSCPPPVPDTHAMTLRPSSVPLRVLLPAPPESSLPEVPDPESDCARAASPTVSRLLANAVTDPSFESTAASALVAELLAFAVACCLDYATALVAESTSASPPQRQGVDYFQTFSSTPKMTTLRVLLHVAAQRDYELHSLDFSTAFLQGNLHEEIWLHRPPGFTRSFHAGTQWSLRRPVYALCQAPHEWHDSLRTTLAALGFAPSTADPSLFLRTDTSLPPFYVLVYIEDLVFATPDTEALTLVKSELQKRHTCTDLGELRSYLGLKIT